MKNEHILSAFHWLAEQDKCDTILEKEWDRRVVLATAQSLNRMNNFMKREHLNVRGVASLIEASPQIPGTSPVPIDVVQDSLCSRQYFHDHPHRTLENGKLQCTPQLVKTRDETRRNPYSRCPKRGYNISLQNTNPSPRAALDTACTSQSVSTQPA